MLGWPEGEDADAAYAFFERMNPTVYATLQTHFAGRRADADAVMDALLAFVGTWTHESTQEQGAFWSLNVLKRGPNPRTIVGRSWNGDPHRLYAHGATNIWIEPGEGVVRFSSMDEHAGIARGVIRLADDGETIEWDWRRTGADGQSAVFPIETLLLDSDHYRMSVGGRSIDYERVDEIPDAFRDAVDLGREE